MGENLKISGYLGLLFGERCVSVAAEWETYIFD